MPNNIEKKELGIRVAPATVTATCRYHLFDPEILDHVLNYLEKEAKLTADTALLETTALVATEVYWA